MVSVLSLQCPVCGAPFTPGAERCGYCGSILVLQTDHPRIDPRTVNRAVVDKHIAEYREMLRADPGAVKAHYGLGVAYFNLGLTEAAISSLGKASDLTPENPHIHSQLAVAWREEARTGNAVAIGEMRDHIRYALRLDPNNAEALILASEEAGRDHDIEQAVAYSERAWKLEPERARDLHERMLRTWIGWKRQRGDVTDADVRRVTEFSPALADELMPMRRPVRDVPPPAQTSGALPAASASWPTMAPSVTVPRSPLVAGFRGCAKAVLITIGLFFAGVFATAINSTLGTFFAYIVLASMLLWIILPILAVRRVTTDTHERDHRS